MPPQKYYDEGYDDGYDDGFREGVFYVEQNLAAKESRTTGRGRAYISGRSSSFKIPSKRPHGGGRRSIRSRPKRKLSAWNKFVKANSKNPRFKYRDGKLNLKKMGVAFRKTPAGRKKK